MRQALGFVALTACVAGLFATPAERDFSGDWILVPERTDARSVGDPEPFLKVQQDERSLHCSTTIGGSDAAWTYALDGSDTRSTVGKESRNTAVKWEGAALLVNTLVSGPRNYTVMDRWQLSADRATLTISRHVVDRNGEVEGRLVYRRAGSGAAPRPPAASPAQPVLTPRAPEAATPPDQPTVAAGTRVLLQLVNSLNTRRSKDGDHVYLRSVVPVAVNDRIVIPRGADVNGTIVEVKGKKGKGDLYIRFDTLVLPDGRTFDLRARPEGSKEGKIAGAPDHGSDIRKVGVGAGIGASIGGIAGSAAGHGVAGLGIGGLAGAAAGLGTVLAKRPEVTLPAGTQVEMVIERDLRF